MKAWLIDKFTGIDALRMAEISDPIPGPREAVLRLSLAALNPADRYMAQNEYPFRGSLPHILGRDGLGVVESVAPNVTDFKIGDRVIVLRSEIGVNRAGTFAQKVAVPVESLEAVPAGWTDQQAASAPLVYLTAWQALSMWGHLPPSVVLITGASGGVGVAAVQLAAAVGHTVIALSRSKSKAETLKSIGANFCFDPAEKDWPAQLKQSLGNRKVDLAIDNIGGPEFSQVISTLGHGGKVSVVGRLAGPVPEFNTSALLFRRLKIGGVAVGDYTPAEAQTAWQPIVRTMSQARATPLIDSEFAFEDLPAAFEKLKAGPMGKVLLRIA
jgi:NADPH2:quinone reductase